MDKKPWNTAMVNAHLDDAMLKALKGHSFHSLAGRLPAKFKKIIQKIMNRG